MKYRIKSLYDNILNLQQVPSKYSDIRQMFIPKKGNVFIFSDYSQQEMMAVGAIAHDDKMLESFKKGRDIYSHIASIAFNVPYEDCLEFYTDGTTNKEGKSRRKKAKAIALGIIYGKGVATIADDLHIDISKAQEIKDSILKAFPQLASYLTHVVEFCKENGYVKTFYGRKRRLPDIQLNEYEFEFPEGVDEKTKKYYIGLYTGKLNKCKRLYEKKDIINHALNKYNIQIRQNGGLIAKAVRESYNAPVQGSAADITKKAMLNICTNKELKELGAELMLTIHDETCTSVPKENAYRAAQLIEQCSIDAGEGLGAPLRCDIVVSDRWEGQQYTFDENYNLIPLVNKGG